MLSRIKNLIVSRSTRRFTTGEIKLWGKIFDGSHSNSIKRESKRMKQFHDKMKTQTPHDFERLNNLVLIDVDPDSGEFIPESEKEITKWGDWQHGGRVSDF